MTRGWEKALGRIRLLGPDDPRFNVDVAYVYGLLEELTRPVPRVVPPGMSEDAQSEHSAHVPVQARVEGMWWSVDPGEVHVGVAMWQDDQLETAVEMTPRELLGMVQDYQPPLIVIEAFSLRSTRWTGAQSKQAVETLKLIGGVEALALMYGGRVIEQQPSVRHVAQKSPWWKNLTVPANPHVRSAAAHGLYFLKFSKK